MIKSNILLVDDDEVYLFLMNKIIKELTTELKVTSLLDGEEAIEYLSKCTDKNIDAPEVIFLDINMPFLDGWGFLEEFKKLKPKIQNNVNIYMVSSSNMQHDIDKASEFEELTGYVVKPLKEDKLIEIFTDIYADNW